MWLVAWEGTHPLEAVDEAAAQALAHTAQQAGHKRVVHWEIDMGEHE